MLDRLERVRERYEEVTRLLSDPAVVANQDRLRELSKEHSNLTPLMKVYSQYAKAKRDLAGLKEIADTSLDSELKGLALSELDEVKGRLQNLEEELKILLIPRDPNDSRNVIVEIQAGTAKAQALVS